MSDEARDKIRVVLKAAQRAIEKGFLPAAPRERACRYCDFRPVCGPYEELRASTKIRTPLTLLDEVRALP